MISRWAARCAESKQYCNLRTGTVMEASSLPLRLRAVALYLIVSRPEGASSVQLAVVAAI